MNKLAVNLHIRAKDEASGVFNKLKAHAGKMAAGIAGYFGVRFFKSAIDDAKDFEKQMDTVAAVSGATAEELEQLEAVAKRMGAETEFTAMQAAEALESLGRAGLSASDQVQALPPVLELAQANGIALADSADFITKAILGMGLEFSEAGRVADVLTKAAASANTSVEGLGSGLSYAAPTAQALGLSLEETVAIMAQFANAGIDASRAGTSLNGIMLSFQDPASKFNTELDKLGITTDDFGLALTQLAEKGDGGKAAILALGRESGPALQALFNQGIPALTSLTDELNNSAGAAKKAADIMSNNYDGALKGMGSVIDALKLQLSQPILEPLTKGIKQLSAKFRELLADGTIASLGNFIASTFSTANEYIGIAYNKISEFYTLLQNEGVFAAFKAHFNDVFGLAKQLVDTVWQSISALFTLLTGSEPATFGAVFSAALLNIIELASVLVNAFSTGLNVIKTAFYALKGVGLSFFSSIMSGVAQFQSAMAAITFGEMSARWQAEADASKAIADSMAVSMNNSFTKAKQSLDKTTLSVNKTRESMGKLLGIETQTSKKTQQLSGDLKQAADKANLVSKATQTLNINLDQLKGVATTAGRQSSQAFIDIANNANLSANEIAKAATQAISLARTTGDIQGLRRAFKEVGFEVANHPELIQAIINKNIELGGSLDDMPQKWRDIAAEYKKSKQDQENGNKDLIDSDNARHQNKLNHIRAEEVAYIASVNRKIEADRKAYEEKEQRRLASVFNAFDEETSEAYSQLTPENLALLKKAQAASSNKLFNTNFDAEGFIKKLLEKQQASQTVNVNFNANGTQAQGSFGSQQEADNFLDILKTAGSVT